MVNAAAVTIGCMSTPGERLRELRSARKLSTRDVAQLSEGAFTYSYVSYLERGQAPWAKVSVTVLKGFARAFNMSVDALLAYVDGRGEASAIDEGAIQGRSIPVYDLVGAGDGLDGGVVVDTAQIPVYWKGEYVGYEIEGDSMAPRIPAGSRVIARRDQSVKPGDIVVAYVPEHGMVVKRYAYNEPDGLVVLTSDNPEFEPIFTREMTPLGVVTEVRIRPS